VVDQNAPHHPGGDAEELRAILPGDAILPQEAEVGFVNECSGLKRVIPTLARQVGGGSPAEMLVDKGHERIASLRIAAGPRAQ
jgi:hypothetical protein